MNLSIKILRAMRQLDHWYFHTPFARQSSGLSLNSVVMGRQYDAMSATGYSWSLDVDNGVSTGLKVRDIGIADLLQWCSILWIFVSQSIVIWYLEKCVHCSILNADSAVMSNLIIMEVIAGLSSAYPHVLGPNHIKFR